jgi:hypothetical protein
LDAGGEACVRRGEIDMVTEIPRRKLRITPQLMVAQGIFMAVFCTIGMYLIDYSQIFGSGLRSQPLIFYPLFGLAMGVTFPFAWAWLMRKMLRAQ